MLVSQWLRMGGAKMGEARSHVGCYISCESERNSGSCSWLGSGGLVLGGERWRHKKSGSRSSPQKRWTTSWSGPRSEGLSHTGPSSINVDMVGRREHGGLAAESLRVEGLWKPPEASWQKPGAMMCLQASVLGGGGGVQLPSGSSYNNGVVVGDPFSLS